MTTTHSFSLLTRLLGTTATGRDYKLAENYVLLRNAVFATTPESVGVIGERGTNRVWGLVMECGYPETVASLVVFADGTVSLYFSNGGGMIGLGSHEGPQRASRALLKIAPRFLGYCDPAAKFPLPLKQHVSFYLFGQDGILSSEARDADISSDNHPLSPLYHIAHELITEIRVLDRKRQA